MSLPVVPLGQLQVSRLCYGTLTLGPLQRDLPPERGGELIAYAAEKGCTFVDTAEYYRNYAHIAHALKRAPNLVIATKTYAYDEATAEASHRKAQRELGREYIDIFLLHEQESLHTLRGHEGALRYFCRQRDAGHIGAVGISCHHVAAAEAAPGFARAYGGLDVLHPIYNRAGLGIADGDRTQMQAAIRAAHEAGMGVYGMKALGGGHLIEDAQDAMSFVLAEPAIDAVAVGMQSEAEIDMNVALFSEEQVPEEARRACRGMPRRLLIESWCEGCGACVARCGQGALSIVDGKAKVTETRCVRCGYCAAVCPSFCIKVI